MRILGIELELACARGLRGGGGGETRAQEPPLQATIQSNTENTKAVYNVTFHFHSHICDRNHHCYLDTRLYLQREVHFADHPIKGKSTSESKYLAERFASFKLFQTFILSRRGCYCGS